MLEIQDLLLLSKDTPIATVTHGILKPILPERLPLFLKRTADISTWLESRAVDSHRTNSRLLKRVLRLEHKDDVSTVLSVNAATITDNYWVKPLSDMTTSYTDVRFQINRFDNLALTGDVNSFNQSPSRTPELTNTGSFEKCWRLYGGVWWIVKAGKPAELFSELLAYRLGELLGFPMAQYEPEGNFIRSRDFTNCGKMDFEPAAGLIGEQPDYIKIYEILKPLGKTVTKAYIEMCYFDALILNMDRHENNFGVLRDSDTGEVLSLAPFYDHNIALVSNGYPRADVSENDRLISDFTELVRHAGQPLSIRELTLAEIEKQTQSIPWELPITQEVQNPKQFVARYLRNRQERLKAQNREWVWFTKSKDRDAR